MLGQTFYHQTIRQYVAVFGTLFNDISIQKKNSSGNIVSTIKVPVAYGPKQKFLNRLQSDPNLDRQISIKLPRIGFEMTNINYDPERKLNPIGRQFRKSFDDGNRILKSLYNPNPYTFDFRLFLFVENAEDGTQILEQILPFFTPEFTVSVNILTEMGIKLDVPIILNSASVEDEYIGDFTQRRAIVWTLDFTLKGFIYPNIKSSDKIIKSISIAFRDLDINNQGEFNLDYLELESSTNYANERIKLENDDYFLFETSNDNLSHRNVISDITIEPQTENSKELVDKTLTIFNPPVLYDADTDEYES